jgi:hypothetical protein
VQARGRRLFVVLLFLVGASAAILVLSPGPSPRRQSANAAFQKQVGGLGFGPVLTLSECPFGFDPRLDGGCGQAAGLVPGGTCFCPRHGGLVSYPPRQPCPAGQGRR